ncbi:MULTISPECIES: bacteriocin-like peptide, LSEI_2386 family [Lacticaseibacillus]
MTDRKSSQKETIMSDCSLSQVHGGTNRVSSQAFEDLKSWIAGLFRGKH